MARGGPTPLRTRPGTGGPGDGTTHQRGHPPARQPRHGRADVRWPRHKRPPARLRRPGNRTNRRRGCADGGDHGQDSRSSCGDRLPPSLTPDYLPGDSLNLHQASNSHVAQAWYVSQRLRRSHHTAPHCIHLACSTIDGHRTEINMGCCTLALLLNNAAHRVLDGLSVRTEKCRWFKSVKGNCLAAGMQIMPVSLCLPCFQAPCSMIVESHVSTYLYGSSYP